MRRPRSRLEAATSLYVYVLPILSLYDKTGRP